MSWRSVKLGRLRFFWVSGPVVRLGPWADGGYSNRGFNVVRWWSFGRLFIERLWSHVDETT